MQELPFAFALVAGAVAAVNPCGFALLPVYAGFLITGEADETVSRRRALGRAGLFTLALTIGFVTVFGAFGLLVSFAAVSITAFLPWITIVVGAAVAAAGVWLLLGRDLPSFVPIAELLGERLFEMEQRLSDTVFKAVPQRVAGTLHTLAGKEYRRGLTGRSLTVRITDEQLAALVGTSRETTTKVLGELADAGVVKLGRGRITVVRPLGLKEAAEAPGR